MFEEVSRNKTTIIIAMVAIFGTFAFLFYILWDAGQTVEEMGRLTQKLISTIY